MIDSALTAGSDSSVDRLLAEAELNKYSDLSRMLACAEAAAAEAQTLGDFRRFALALTQQAWAYVNMNRLEPSLLHIREALILARTHRFTAIEARAVNTIALCFVQSGIMQEAARLYEYQLELGQRLQDGELQATALHDWAIMVQNDGDLDRALEMMHRALALMPPDAHQGLDHAVMHGNLALVYNDAGNLDEAVFHAQQSLMLARSGECGPLIGLAHTILASVYQSADQLEAAYGQIAAAREFVDSSEPTTLSANIEFLVGVLLDHEGRRADAVHAWERAYELAVRGEMIDFAISILNKIKAAHEQSGSIGELVGVYKRLTQDIPRLQKQGSDLRFSVLQMVFAIDKAAHRSEVELNQQKSAILHRLSHEFRTPLTVIQSTAEIVEKYGERLSLEQRQERLQRITGQVRWMTVMLEDIGELLRLDDGMPPTMLVTAFELRDLVQLALDGLGRYRLPTTRVNVTLQPEQASLHGPLQTLATIATQLLSNAIKFSQAQVALDLSYTSGVLTMRVADEGIGIPKAQQAEIFKPLVRGTNLDEVTGTGVGLTIVSKLVNFLHGTIALTSVEGTGTTVTVRVPLEVPRGELSSGG
jgi:signal transduction histidine kinase